MMKLCGAAQTYTQTRTSLTAEVESRIHHIRTCTVCNSCTCACIRLQQHRELRFTRLQPGRQACMRPGQTAPVSSNAHATHTCAQSHDISDSSLSRSFSVYHEIFLHISQMQQANLAPKDGPTQRKLTRHTGKDTKHQHHTNPLALKGYKPSHSSQKYQS